MASINWGAVREVAVCADDVFKQHTQLWRIRLLRCVRRRNDKTERAGRCRELSANCKKGSVNKKRSRQLLLARGFPCPPKKIQTRRREIPEKRTPSPAGELNNCVPGSFGSD